MISYTLVSVYSAVPRWQRDNYADWREDHPKAERVTVSLNYNRANANRRWDSEANTGARGMPTARFNFPSKRSSDL